MFKPSLIWAEYFVTLFFSVFFFVLLHLLLNILINSCVEQLVCLSPKYLVDDFVLVPRFRPIIGSLLWIFLCLLSTLFSAAILIIVWSCGEIANYIKFYFSALFLLGWGGLQRSKQTSQYFSLFTEKINHKSSSKSTFNLSNLIIIGDCSSGNTGWVYQDKTEKYRVHNWTAWPECSVEQSIKILSYSPVQLSSDVTVREVRPADCSTQGPRSAQMSALLFQILSLDRHLVLCHKDTLKGRKCA